MKKATGKNNNMLIACVSILLALILIAMSVLIAWEVTGGDWFGTDEDEQTDDSNGDVIDDDGNTLVSGTVYDLPRAIAFTTVSSESASATEGITLTATLNPSQAVDKTVDWAVSFADGASDWATGKTATDYITVTPDSDGSTTATMLCLEAFGEQIIVTVTARANTNVTATCTVDYAQKVESLSLYIGETEVNLGGDTDVTIDIGSSSSSSGGEVRLEYTLSAVYTIAETNIPEVNFVRNSGTTYFSYIYYYSGSTTNGIEYLDIENAVGKNLYFDLRLFSDYEFYYYSTGWTTDDEGYAILGINETYLADMGTAELIVYYNNRSDYPLWTIEVTLEGSYTGYTSTWTSDMYWSAYTLNVSSITLDPESVVY